MTATLWDLEAALARAALGAPFEVHRAWGAGAFTHALTSDVCIAVTAACRRWIDQGNRPVSGNGMSLAVKAKTSLIVAGAWFDDGNFFEPHDGMWTAPSWGSVHLAAAICWNGESGIEAAAWRAALDDWMKFNTAELA